jgi:hypothetical protein
LRRILPNYKEWIAMKIIEMFKDRAEVQALTTMVGFNACHYAGADALSVANDKAELARLMNVDIENIFIPRQVHSTNVAMPGEDLEGVDAMVTNRRDCVIAVNTADCLPLLLADIEAGVIAAVHCGWRGTVGGIVQAAVARMESLGAKPSRLVAAIGPCIGPECFEVGEEVAVQFPDATVVGGYAKPHVDLAGAVALQLAELGVNPRNIPRPVACSVCDRRFHSVRREGRQLSYRTLTAIRLR